MHYHHEITDIYHSYDELKSHEMRGRDYDIEYRFKENADFIIVAPHGGKIEKHTSIITKEIAGEQFSYYCFNGAKRGSNLTLHITSNHFDEPTCLQLAERHKHVITIHGYNDQTRQDTAPILLGGKHAALIALLEDKLNQENLPAQSSGHPWPAVSDMNICNKGQSGLGVQIELARTFRENTELSKKFTHIMHHFLMDLRF